MNLQHWQMELLDTMTKNPQRKMAVITGRGTGKSVWAQMVQDMIPPDVKLVTSAPVDGKTWYTVKLTMPAAKWLRRQPGADWQEHKPGNGYFDISDKLYTALTLKWT
jgi:hypothetical protein